jgi:hypothetical protein
MIGLSIQVVPLAAVRFRKSITALSASKVFDTLSLQRTTYSSKMGISLPAMASKPSRMLRKSDAATKKRDEVDDLGTLSSDQSC